MASATLGWFKTLLLKLGLSEINSPAAENLVAGIVDSEIPANDVAIATDALNGTIKLTQDLIVTNPSSVFLQDFLGWQQAFLTNLPALSAISTSQAPTK